MRTLMGIFPLLTIPLIIYNIMAFGFRPGDGAAGEAVTMAAHLAKPIALIPMVAPGSVWSIGWGDLILLLGMALLFVEILKSTSTGSGTILNHAVSMFVFIIALVEFLLIKNFSTSVFFLLAMMCLLDVLAGVVVTIVSARRDFAVQDGFNS